MARPDVQDHGSDSRLRVFVIVVGVMTMLAAAALVVSVAAAGRSSAAHVLTPAPSVAVTTAPPTTTPLATTTTTNVATLKVGPVVRRTSSTPTGTKALPHFDTPQAAMTYLAAAWNAHDMAALDHVTNPAARAALDAMHAEAVNLRLDRCDRRPQGDYLCLFHHDYPAGTSTTVAGGGQAAFVVAPALLPGWYMTVVQSCG